MKYTVTCLHEGCPYLARAGDREVAAAWLYRHLVMAHGASMAVLSLEELRSQPVFDVNDNGPECGMPWKPADGVRVPF